MHFVIVTHFCVFTIGMCNAPSVNSQKCLKIKCVSLTFRAHWQNSKIAKTKLVIVTHIYMHFVIFTHFCVFTIGMCNAPSVNSQKCLKIKCVSLTFRAHWQNSKKAITKLVIVTHIYMHFVIFTHFCVFTIGMCNAPSVNSQKCLKIKCVSLTFRAHWQNSKKAKQNLKCRSRGRE